MILEPFFLTMVAPYVLLTAGFGVGLYLFFTLKSGDRPAQRGMQ